MPEQTEYDGTLEEAREMVEEAEIARTYVEENAPCFIQWFSDPAFADWLGSESVASGPPPSMEELPETLRAYFAEAETCAEDIYGNLPPFEEFYLVCARHLLQTAIQYFSELAVCLFSRFEVHISQTDADALTEAYRQARARDLTADVGKTLVFYRLCELGGLQGATYADKYRDLVERTKEID